MGAAALAEGTFRVGVKQDVYGFGYYDEATGEFSGMEIDLGEKLAEGFQKAVGSIEAWFSSFNARLQAAQESLAQSALDAADAFSQSRSAQSTVIHQTVNFNQPVETPSQAARRVAQANEALADELAGAM